MYVVFVVVVVVVVVVVCVWCVRVHVCMCMRVCVKCTCVFAELISVNFIAEPFAVQGLISCPT